LEETAPSLAAVAEHQRTPTGTGMAVANGAMHALLTYETPPSELPAHIHYADQFYSMPELREALGLEKDAMKPVKPKAYK
jgi:hypothetical protein